MIALVAVPLQPSATFLNMHNRSQSITLVGAGLTGPLLAISLVQRGFRVQIYERRPDMRRCRPARAVDQSRHFHARDSRVA